MKKFTRVIISCLICSLLLGYSCLSVNVNASSNEVLIGLSTGQSKYVAPNVALGAVLYIASGYSVGTLDSLVSATNNWINANSGLKSFLLKNATDFLDKGVIDLPQNIRDIVAETLKNFGYTAPSISALFIPRSLESLNKLKKDDLLGQNVTAIMREDALVQKATQGLIATIFTAISDTYKYLTGGLKTFLENLRNSLATWIGDVNIHLHYLRENFTTIKNQVTGILDTKISDIKTALSAFREQFVEKIKDMRTAVGNILVLTKDTIGAGVTNIRTNISNLYDSVKDGVVNGIDGIKNGLNNLTSSITTGFSDWLLSHFELDEFDEVVPKYETGLIWLKNVYNLLGNFKVGFLAAGAILSQFMDLSFFRTLLIISMAIGFMGVLLGIGLDVSSRISGQSAVRKAEAANKQGFNAGYKAAAEKFSNKGGG